MDPATLAIIKDLGYPAALSIVLLFAVRFMFTTYSTAQTARIEALERAFLSAKKTNDEQSGQLLNRSDKYAAELRAIIAANQATLNEHSRLTRNSQDLLRQLINAISSSWGESPSSFRDSLPQLPDIPATGTHEKKHHEHA